MNLSKAINTVGLTLAGSEGAIRWRSQLSEAFDELCRLARLGAKVEQYLPKVEGDNISNYEITGMTVQWDEN